VHRGAFDGLFSVDVSADLTELGRTNVAVVCAGVKSILDVVSKKNMDFVSSLLA